MIPRNDARARLEQEARRTHHGVIIREQAIAVGLTPAQIDRRVRRRQWLSGPGRRTFILGCHRDNPLAWLCAANQGIQAVAWAQSAMALWGLVDHPGIPTLASTGRSRDQRIALTRRKGLADLPQTTRHGIRTVTLEIALASMAGTNKADLDKLLDEALRRGLTTWPRLREAFGKFVRPSRPGAALIRTIVDERSIDLAIPLSDWSRAFANKLTSSGLPRPLMEHRVLDSSGSLIAQVDLAFPDHHYAIELDSVQFHLNRSAFEVDRRRDTNLAQVGWRVSRFTWSQFEDDWDWVTTAIRAQLGKPQVQQSPFWARSPTPKRVENATWNSGRGRASESRRWTASENR